MPSTPMADCTTLQDIEVGENACSVEYCPVAGLGTYVACSTYALETFCGGHQTNPSSGEDGELETATAVVQIDPEDDSHPGVDTSTTNITDAASGIVPGTEGSSSVVRQTRTGSVAVYKTVSAKPQGAEESERAEHLLLTPVKDGTVVPDGGVLDAKWSEEAMHDGAAVLACATSTGRICLYTLNTLGHAGAYAGPGADPASEKNQAKFGHLTFSEERDCLLLSLDWSGGDIGQAKIVVSQSDGEIAIWRAHPAGGAPVEEMGPWPGHRLRGGLPTEAWISFFRKGGIASEGGGGGGHDASLVVSGGEDAMLKGWDLRGGGSRGALSAFVCKDHEAGVTAGQWHPWRQHIFASGSYDEDVRVWDVRTLRRPVSTFSTGGGVWRLKWHPHPDRGDLLLAACMHAGVCVLDVASSARSPTVGASAGGEATGLAAKFTRHASMAYGADWCRLTPSLNSRTPLVASCSFYDRLLCLWRTPPLWP